MGLVTGQYGWTANMERIMKAQTLGTSGSQGSKKTMEINPYHPAMIELKTKSAADPEDESLKTLAKLLYDSSLMSSGFEIGETSDFSKRMYHVISQGLGVDPNAPVPEEVIIADKKEAEEDEDDEEDEDEKEDTPKKEEEPSKEKEAETGSKAKHEEL